MREQHWFDALNRELVCKAPRRQVLRSAAALAAGLLVGRAAPAAGGAAVNDCATWRRVCDDEWPDDAKERRFCYVKCRRCNRAGTQFCIHKPDAEHPDKHATCCPRGEECCDGTICCPEGSCCVSNDGTFTRFCCPSGQTCCDGTCVDPKTDSNHCDGCGKACRAGKTCCAGACVDRTKDKHNCGVCGRVCASINPLYKYCIDGYCSYCPRGQVLCLGCPGSPYCVTPGDGRCCPPAAGGD
jgi:hypothetical protein